MRHSLFLITYSDITSIYTYNDCYFKENKTSQEQNMELKLCFKSFVTYDAL